MIDFDLLTIDDLGKVDRGRSRHRPRDDVSLYGGNYPFIQTGDVKKAPFYISKFSQTYNEKGLAQSKLWNSGTLCITIAANIADTAILKIGACFPDSILGFIAYKDKTEVKFVKYCFDVSKTTIEAISKGTTQDNLSLEKLRRIKFKVPKLLIQRKIAAILSAYDDLIENNNRRIAILEKMAEELYREWVVRLRFPGHEEVKNVKGVPEGWKTKRMGEVIQYYVGGGWGEENSTAEHSVGAYVIRGTDIPPLNVGQIEKEVFRFHKESNFKSRQLIEGDIVFEVSGGSKDQLLGRTILLTPELIKFFENKVICASFCKLIRPNNGICSSYFLKYFFQSYYKSGLVGTYQIQSTGISNYQFEDFLKYQLIILPQKDILDSFEQRVKPWLRLKDILTQANHKMKYVRDRLLFRLMSGKIDVENMDIAFPALMREELAHA